MLTVKCTWAGHVVLRQDVEEALLQETIDEIKGNLMNGQITHISVGSFFVLEELCVDVWKAGMLSEMFQFDRKEA